MAFVSLIFTAQRLKKLKTSLTEEKLEAIQAHEDETYKKKFRFRHLGVDIRESVKGFCKKLFRCRETSCGYRTCYKLGHEGSCENYVLKSALGFVAGVLLTYFLYIVFIFQLNVVLTSATLICSFLGCVLTLGLAFSSRIRCIVLLTLPQFFSKRGRQALLAYAFVLALTGPAQNTLNNLGILSESLACGQEQLKQAVKQIIDVIKKPFMAIKEAIKTVIKTIKEVVKKIKEILLKIKRVVMAIVRVIKSVFEFLGKIINICNKELGTPFERCSRVFENAIADCNAKLGPLFNWLCSLAYIVKAVCYLVKIFDYVCMIVDFISGSVVGVIIRKIKIFVRHIKTMFYVRIKFSHSFKYKTVSSKSVTEIAKEIVAEVKERSRGIVAFFNFMTSASMLFFMYLVFQVAYYRFKYLTSERFDNVYITQYFREIDQRRAKAGKETVLPLTKKEKLTYVPISSASLSKTERRSLSKNATKLMTASVKLGTHMAADYSLYWVLTLISRHARYQSKVQAPNFPVAHVSGEGFLAMLLRAIVNAFQPVGIKLEIDTVPCLPIPIPPDFDRYVQIGTIHHNLPKNKKITTLEMLYTAGAGDIHQRILDPILHGRWLSVREAAQIALYLAGYRNQNEVKQVCGIFRICLGSDLQLTCLLCGEVFRAKDKNKFVKCTTPQCPGLFCIECFADLKNICPVCLSPLEYGDLDDLDEEKDSSGDEPPWDKPKKRRRRNCPTWLPCGKVKDDDDDEAAPASETNQEEEEEEQLEEKGEESDSSTDYSFSYQYDEDNKQPVSDVTPWRDMEMQAIPEEVSMEVFQEHEEEEETLFIDLDNQIRVPKGHAALVRMDVQARVGDSDETEHEERVCLDLDNQIKLPGGSEVSTDDLICQCSSASSPRRVEFIGIPQDDVYKRVRRLKDFPYCTCSDLEEPTRSTMSTSTRSDCKFCKCPDDVDVHSTLLAGTETEEELQQVVPKLDLSFLEEKCSCDNPVLSSRFSYVSFQEVQETPPGSASDQSLQSSSVLSSLENSPEVQPLLRKRALTTQCSIPKVESPSSVDSYELRKMQGRKTRKYYEATGVLCEDKQCQYSGGEKRRSIKDMFKRLLPKRNRGQNCLPLHCKDLDEVVQVQSYNYNDEGWDTLDVDTDDSPTYPFGTSSGSEEEDDAQELLGRKRIRGGQCTHLVSCKLIGRKCPSKRVRSFDAKSRTKLKDFSTLSLPPKPKPTNSKEFISQLLFGIEALQEEKALSMPETDSPALIEKKESSDFIISAEAAASTLPAYNTPPSSDSGLSETTCAQIFGSPCPKGIGKGSRTHYLDVKGEDTIELVGEEELVVVETGKGEEVEGIELREEKSVQQLDNKDKEGSISSLALQVNVARSTSEATYRSKTSSDLRKSIDSLKSKTSSTIGTIKEQDKAKLEDTTEDKFEAKAQRDSTKLSRESLETPYRLSSTHSSPHDLQPTKSSAKRKSTQLNQLLYKDERTEISLVQKLSPEKSRVSTASTPVASPRNTPSVKLQINLHNSIIPEEEAQVDPEVISMRSQDKIVETKDTFPVQPDWTPHSSEKLISANDKMQQTSENEIYKNASGRRSSSLVSPQYKPSTSTDQPVSEGYYTSDLPEKDVVCKNNCNCSICLIARTHQASAMCTCCRCAYAPRRRSNILTYHAPEFLPSSTESELPPPPPPPPMRRSPPRLARPAGYRRACIEQCECCLRRGFAGDFTRHYHPDPYRFPSYEQSYDEPTLSDLPYQNNDDYLELVHELQDTLHSRNRNRVRRAMQEFESRSKQNKPLEKPIINYDETSESEEPIIRKVEQLRGDRKACCAEDKCSCLRPKGQPRRVEERSAKWTMDPDSGEWQKGRRRRRRGNAEEEAQEEFEQCNCSCNCGHRYQ